MTSAALSSVIILSVGLAMIGINLVSAVILFREKCLGTWLMLIGGLVTMVCGLAIRVFYDWLSLLFREWVGIKASYQYLTALSAASSLGGVLFSGGLLLYALRQRAKADRVTELESLIASMQGR